MRDALGRVQSVLVLGGSSDIGIAVAERLVRGGARRVVLGARQPEALNPQVSRLVEVGATTIDTVIFDADRPDTHREVIVHATDAVGDLDVVVVAHGVLGDDATYHDPVAAAALVTTNTAGAISACLAATERLRHQGHGTLVVLSSVTVERVRASNHVYGASKAGLDAFAQGLADELVGSGVRVLVVRPGFVHSKMTTGLEPTPLSSTPEEVAEAVATGLAGQAVTIWVPDKLRWVFAAVRHLPRPIWRRVAADR